MMEYNYGKRVDGLKDRNKIERLRNIYDDKVVVFLMNEPYETLNETAERLDIDIEESDT